MDGKNINDNSIYYHFYMKDYTRKKIARWYDTINGAFHSVRFEKNRDLILYSKLQNMLDSKTVGDIKVAKNFFDDEWQKEVYMKGFINIMKKINGKWGSICHLNRMLR